MEWSFVHGPTADQPAQEPFRFPNSRVGVGYIKQKPTDSTNERASSVVRRGSPSSRHLSRRRCSSSSSVMNAYFTTETRKNAV